MKYETEILTVTELFGVSNFSRSSCLEALSKHFTFSGAKALTRYTGNKIMLEGFIISGSVYCRLCRSQQL